MDALETPAPTCHICEATGMHICTDGLRRLPLRLPLSVETPCEHVDHTDQACCPIWEHEHHVQPHRGCVLR